MSRRVKDLRVWYKPKNWSPLTLVSESLSEGQGQDLTTVVKAECPLPKILGTSKVTIFQSFSDVRIFAWIFTSETS